MVQTREEWIDDNTVSLGSSEEMLKRLPLCKGKGVVLTATFDVRSRESNRLMFKSVRPYIEIMPYIGTKVVQKRICSRISFSADALWKVRILQTANKSERFYILGYIKLVYENRRPAVTLNLAEDIVPCPIMTESFFMDHYSQFRNRCYRWARPEDTREETPAVVHRNSNRTLLLRALPGKQAYYLQVLKRVGKKRRVAEAWERYKMLQWQEMKAINNASHSFQTILANGKGVEEREEALHDPARKNPKGKDSLQHYGNKYAKGRLLDESVNLVSDTHFDIVRQWETEFNTRERTVVFHGCRCNLEDDVIFIRNELEQWQVRYSKEKHKIVLYHKNRKKDRHSRKKVVIDGYHEQFVSTIEGNPSIKEYVIYACLHKFKVVSDNEKQNRKRKR